MHAPWWARLALFVLVIMSLRITRKLLWRWWLLLLWQEVTRLGPRATWIGRRLITPMCSFFVHTYELSAPVVPQPRVPLG